MNSDAPPAGPPPSYVQATSTGGSAASRPANQSSNSRLDVPQARNNIPVASRRSMEDEVRPLPRGWVRQWDAKEKHQFFVDTRANPPRSIWHHPYDDDEYLKSVSSEERERIQEENSKLAKSKDHDLDSLEDVPYHSQYAQQGRQNSAELPPRPTGQRQDSAAPKGLMKLKDKLTGSTHEERVRKRQQRDEEERQYYAAQQRFRECMDQAMSTGQPVFYGKDKDGRDVYIEPPGGPGAGYGGYGQYGQYGQQQGRPGAYGVNPYSSGPYADPNARFIRPQQQYARPYGYGYGGGMYPGGLAMPMMGGLMGGMLLGGLLF